MTGSCYNHAPVIGRTSDRMTECEERLLDACTEHAEQIVAWCVLPNHYHVLISTKDVKQVLYQIGRFHGRASHSWNSEEECPGRQVWCKCSETLMKSEGHFFATLNYIHHNPVKHGYTHRWQDWPWSGATRYLEEVGRTKATELWHRYPVGNYGNRWDVYPAPPVHQKPG